MTTAVSMWALHSAGSLGVFEHRQNSSISVLLLLAVYLDAHYICYHVPIAFDLRHDLGNMAECVLNGFGRDPIKLYADLSRIYIKDTENGHISGCISF